MKNKKVLLVIILAFILLMVGASVLYDRLGEGMTTEQMIVHTEAEPTATPAVEENTAEPEAMEEASTEEPEAQDTAEPEATGEASTEEPEAQDTAEPEVTEEASTEEPEAQAFVAPDFTVYDRDGNPVRLSEYFGKPIVLNFWASWCGPCKMEMPDFNEKYAEIGEEVHFMMVNITTGRETLETATAFIDQSGYQFPVYYDTSSEAAMTYGAYSLPTSFFINAEGHLIAQAVGAIDSATLQRGLDLIME